MKRNNLAPAILLSMFAFASIAWGDVQAVMRWSKIRAEAQNHCVEVYLAPLRAHYVDPGNALAIAKHLCDDDRIYFPFAFGMSADRSPPNPKFHSNRHRKRYQRAQVRARNKTLEDLDQLRSRYLPLKHHSPVTLGLVGASKRQTDAILEALREARHPWSERTFRWHNDPIAFENWRVRQLRGGVFPGLIHVHVARGNPVDLQSARALLETTFTQHTGTTSPYTNDFSEYTIVITSDEDLDQSLTPVDMSIPWLRMQKDSCEFVMQ